MEFQLNARWVMNHSHGPGRDGCIFFNGNGLEPFGRVIYGWLPFEVSGPMVKSTVTNAVPCGKAWLALWWGLPLLQQLLLPVFVKLFHDPRLAICYLSSNMGLIGRIHSNSGKLCFPIPILIFWSWNWNILFLRFEIKFWIWFNCTWACTSVVWQLHYL